ncbi:MAG: ABC transporter substrate-binding protein [Clostridiales bacterium]|jgi:NitT/TauT family transport system substrate-binding protein|nr:ABC transporter substrate-binding protein [Clostridiales bacterium]
MRAKFALAAALTMSLLTACGDKSATASKEIPTIKVGYIVQDSVRPGLVVAAKQLGYYDEEGVNVELVPVDSVPSGIAAVSTRKLDLFSLSVRALSSIAKGGDETFIGGVATEGSSLVVSKENSEIDFRDFHNLKGKVIGKNPADPIELIFKDYVKESLGAEYTDDYIQWKDFDDNNVLLEAISKGSVDGGFLTTERVWLAEERGLKEAFDLAEFLPEYLCCRLTSTNATVKEKRDALVAILRAQIRAEIDYKNDTDKVIDALEEFTKQKRDHIIRYVGVHKDYAVDAFTDFKNPLSTNLMYNKIKQYDDVSVNFGFYERNPNVDLKEHVDPTLWQDAIKELIDRYPDVPEYKELNEFFLKDSSEYWN